MIMKKINYGRQWVDQDDIDAVIQTMMSDFITCGPKVEEFEKAIADYTGAKYCVIVSSGTAALHLAVRALNISNTEGITSAITFVASSNSMLYNQIKPIFADIDLSTYNICLEDFKTKINKNTKLLMPVHYAGRACNMEELHIYAKKNDLFVIEDAAHAIGSKYSDGSMVGNCKYSDMTTFSFHPVKAITTGEGGAITTNNEFLYNSLLRLRNHSIVSNKDLFTYSENAYTNGDENQWYYEVQDLGFNYRLTDIQASLGISQLKKLPNFIKLRQDIAEYYNTVFENEDCLKIPSNENLKGNAFHLYPLLIDFDKLRVTRSQFIRSLREYNVYTQVHYVPVYFHPYYQTNGYKDTKCSNAEYFYKRELSIPIYPKMTFDEVKHVVETLKRNVRRNSCA